MGKENKDQEGPKWSDKVKFHPWIGENYKNGVVGYDENGIIQYGESEGEGKKILVLGESHYCYDESEAIPELTQEIIKDLIDPDSEWEPYKNTYTKFIKSLTGGIPDFNHNVKLKAWQHVAFYNYIQKPLIGPRVSPQKEDFEISENAFWEVLNFLEPNFIIAWGVRLYNNLPMQGKQHSDMELDIDGEEYAFELWEYELNGTKVLVLPVIHPSAAYTPVFWRQVIESLLKMK